MRYVLLIIMVVAVAMGRAQEQVGSERKQKADNLNVNLHDSLGTLKRTVRGFGAIDTTYVEPQHYNWSFMLQSTFNYDVYWLRSGDQRLTLSPDVVMRVGPYFGWRWLFLGTTIELKNIGVDRENNKLKREFMLSLYSAQIGVDLFYRRTGNDYKIRRARFTNADGDDESLNGVPFSGLNVGITGANVYYIFNHNRFSYPAAFAQSTCQKVSCGSWMVGLGYTRQSVELDAEALEETIRENTKMEVELDSGLMFNRIVYYDINFSAGYAYNWVFAKRWLLCGSGSLALAFKQSEGDLAGAAEHLTLRHMNLDGIGRLGIVWNNTKWYAGANGIMHVYTYRKSRFTANNIFGSINLYAGVNFGMRKSYKKKLNKKLE